MKTMAVIISVFLLVELVSFNTPVSLETNEVELYTNNTLENFSLLHYTPIVITQKNTFCYQETYYIVYLSKEQQPPEHESLA